MGLFFLFFLFSTVFGETDMLCEAPASPKNGYLIPVKKRFHKGDTVKHYCHSGNFSQENFTTRYSSTVNVTCMGNGIWNRSTPTCNFQDYFMDKKITPAPRKGSFQRERHKACATLEFLSDQKPKDLRIWDVLRDEFDGPLDVFVEIVNISSQFEILELRVEYNQKSNTAEWQKCGSVNYTLTRQNSTALVLRCEIPANRKPHDIKLRFFSWNNGERTFEICSIKGLALDGNGCAKPATPSFGVVKIINSSAWYSCENGYNLTGNEERKCVKTKSGYTWNPDVIPMCVFESQRNIKDPQSNKVHLPGGFVALIVVAIVAPVCVVLYFLYWAKTRNAKATEHIYERINDSFCGVFRGNFVSRCRRSIFKLPTVRTPAPEGLLQHQRTLRFAALSHGSVYSELPASSAVQPGTESTINGQVCEDRRSFVDDGVNYDELILFRSNSASKPAFDGTCCSNDKPYVEIGGNSDTKNALTTPRVNFHRSQCDGTSETKVEAVVVPVRIEHNLINGALYAQVEKNAK